MILFSGKFLYLIVFNVIMKKTKREYINKKIIFSLINVVDFNCS